MPAEADSTLIRRRPQAARRAESDRRMMRAALKLIAERGSSGISMAQIGLEAGYSRGLPAERFGNKVALLEAVVDFSDQWFQKRLAKALAGKRGLAAVKARIDAHLDGARDASGAAIALYQLYMESMSTVVELRPRIAALSRSYREGFKSHLREAIELGEVCGDFDPDEQATLIVGAMRGIMIQALIDGGVTDLDAAKTYLFEMFAKALSTRGTT